MKSLLFGAGTYGQVYLSYLLEAGIESLIGTDVVVLKDVPKRVL